MREARRVPMIGVATQRRPRGRPRGRRPGHPRDGTVREDRRAAAASTAAGAMAAKRRHPTQAQRRRTGHPGGHASPARVHLRGPLALPRQAGYNKRLRGAAGLLRSAIRAVATDTSLWTDDVWIIDSTPVECGRSRETTKRSALAGWAQYGYCASHSRYFWGLRLHLICTLHGLPVAFALAGAKAVERDVLLDLLAAESQLVAERPGQTLLADKHYYGHQFEAVLGGLGVRLLRPARKGEPERPGACLFKPLRQLIESVNDTFKGQLDLELHGGRTPGGVAVRVLQRILALAAAIWHNHKTGQPTLRSLVAYDH